MRAANHIMSIYVVYMHTQLQFINFGLNAPAAA